MAARQWDDLPGLERGSQYSSEVPQPCNPHRIGSDPIRSSDPHGSPPHRVAPGCDPGSQRGTQPAARYQSYDGGCTKTTCSWPSLRTGGGFRVSVVLVTSGFCCSSEVSAVGFGVTRHSGVTPAHSMLAPEVSSRTCPTWCRVLSVYRRDFARIPIRMALVLSMNTCCDRVAATY